MTQPFLTITAALDEVSKYIHDVRWNSNGIIEVTFTEASFNMDGICEYLCGLGDMLYRAWGIHYSFVST